MRNACLVFVTIVMAAAANPVRARDNRFALTDEVLDNFQRLFVDPPNCEALAAGALRGLRRAVPGASVEVGDRPGEFVFSLSRKASSKATIDGSSLAGLKQSLHAVLGMVLGHPKYTAKALALQRKMLRAMVAACGDRWTAFLLPRFYARLLDDGSGEKASAGVGLLRRGEKLQVVSVEEGSPAEKAGIAPGMVVDAIAGIPAERLHELEATALLLGKPGETVTMKADGRAYSLKLEKIPPRNIAVDPPSRGIARVKLYNFRPGTAERLKRVLARLEGMGMKALVLDLRGNPGGLIEEGVAVASLFAPAGDLVKLVGRGRARIEVFRSERAGRWRDLPLAVLVDESSASVAEMLAMILRDSRNAQLVGRPTMGKGVVQVLVELSDGSALKLSTSRYASAGGHLLFGPLEPDWVTRRPSAGGPDEDLRQAFRLLKKR